MSSFLKYLEKYEEKENDIVFYLRDVPSSRLEGEKIVRELYIYFFHDEELQLNRVHKLGDLIYKIEKEQAYFCLNCSEPIFFEEGSNYITTCDRCNWRNELDDTPAISPIVLKSRDLENNNIQICYPLLEKALLQQLPEKLREAIETYFCNPQDLTKDMYDNIYHNIYEKDIAKMTKRMKSLSSKIEFVRFFKNTNFP
jgi:hypothetical protein